MEYISKNIRVYFKWRQEYLEIWEKYYGYVSPLDTKENLAKELVGIIYERNLITFEQYTADIQQIEEEGLASSYWNRVYNQAFIPFEVTRELYYNYIVE